jgi:chlorite dismutase
MPDKALFEELLKAQGLVPGTPEFEEAIAKKMAWRAETEHYRLYPELPDWELMAFYPMSKRRSGADNWYSLDFETRRRLMDGHGKVGRKYAGRISQLISGSTGLDEFEWGVTLMAHQTDALKEIVYEMRFDEVSARFGEFGRFFVNLRLAPELLWQHLHL